MGRARVLRMCSSSGVWTSRRKCFSAEMSRARRPWSRRFGLRASRRCRCPSLRRGRGLRTSRRANLGDTEGASPADSSEPTTAGRRALRWRGDESEIVCAHSDSEPSLKPGDTIVVPVSYGGIRRGCFDPTSTEPVQDRAEQAELFARARPVLRLHPVVVDKLGLAVPLDDPDEARTVLGRLASNGDWPPWKRLWGEKLAKGRGSLVVAGEPSWTVIEARRVPLAALRAVLQPEETLEDGVELTTDSDDSFHAGRAVSLAEHSADVETFAREYAARCGLGTRLAEHVAIAAWLHDIGKADRRFQLMLRGGSEIDSSRTRRRGPSRRCRLAPVRHIDSRSRRAAIREERATKSSHSQCCKESWKP